jgi:hypothetical protein
MGLNRRGLHANDAGFFIFSSLCLLPLFAYPGTRLIRNIVIYFMTAERDMFASSSSVGLVFALAACAGLLRC